MMIDEQQLLNKISLLRLALEYYADDANYVNNQIFKDKGAIARDTLKTISKIDNEMKLSEEIFDIRIQEIKNNDIDTTELLDTLSKLDELNKKINL